MQKIIEYLAANPFYTTVLVASAIVIAIAVLITIIAYKSRNSKRKNEKIEISDNYFPSLGQDAKETPENIVNPEIFDNPERKNAEQTARTTSTDVQTKTADEDALHKLKDEPKAEAKTEQKAEPKDEPQKHEKQRSPRPAANASKPIKDGASAEKLFADREEKSETADEVEEASVPARYAGKWEIVHDGTRFSAYLKASNGEIMLATESYTSLSGMKSGIDTLKKNIERENYAINLDKNGNFVFKIFSTANRLLCVGEGYSTREQCEKAFSSVKRFAKTAKIVISENE